MTFEGKEKWRQGIEGEEEKNETGEGRTVSLVDPETESDSCDDDVDLI